MGDFKKHPEIAKEKLSALKNAYDNKQFSVVGDLATKICEQLVEADGAKEGLHFGAHLERHDYSNRKFPSEIQQRILFKNEKNISISRAFTKAGW